MTGLDEIAALHLIGSLTSPSTCEPVKAKTSAMDEPISGFVSVWDYEKLCPPHPAPKDIPADTSSPSPSKPAHTRARRSIAHQKSSTMAVPAFGDITKAANDVSSSIE